MSEHQQIFKLRYFCTISIIYQPTINMDGRSNARFHVLVDCIALWLGRFIPTPTRPMGVATKILAWFQ
jgi:hypothetical protein